MAGSAPSPSFFAAAMGDFEILNLYDAEEAAFDPLTSPTTSNSPAELFGFPCITSQATNIMAPNLPPHVPPSPLARDLDEIAYGNVFPMMNSEGQNQIIFESPIPSGVYHQTDGLVHPPVPDGRASIHSQPGTYQFESPLNKPVHILEDLSSPTSSEMQGFQESESFSPKLRKTRALTAAKRVSGAALSDKDEEKRQEALSRNRKAAQKCRRKKKDKMRCLENTVKELEETKTHLTERVHRLKEEVIFLKTLILRHSNCECVGVREYIANRARYLIGSGMPPTSTNGGPTRSATRS